LPTCPVPKKNNPKRGAALSRADFPDKAGKISGVDAMVEENNPVPQIKMSVLAQYIRDLSFENAVAIKGINASEIQPDVQIAVSLDARKRSAEHQYDVLLKFKVASKNKSSDDTLFLLELDYAGVFHVEGVAEEQLHPYLLIECPRLLFPFVRRIISDVTRDGGFPPLNIDTVDFLSLYRTELARRAAQSTETA
jgi:preprotein translocase subunit SecB